VASPSGEADAMGTVNVDTTRSTIGAIVHFAAARHMANMFARNGLRGLYSTASRDKAAIRR
jgi:hypothetical protein